MINSLCICDVLELNKDIVQLGTQYIRIMLLYTSFDFKQAMGEAYAEDYNDLRVLYNNTITRLIC